MGMSLRTTETHRTTHVATLDGDELRQLVIDRVWPSLGVDPEAPGLRVSVLLTTKPGQSGAEVTQATVTVEVNHEQSGRQA